MSTVLFEDLDLNPQILRAIKEMGFEEATPIQAQSIPAVMSGRDVIGQAQTGTGKTASFGIPLLHKVDPKLKKTQALIYARPVSLPFRYPTSYTIWQNTPTVSKSFRFTVDRRLANRSVP